MIDIEIEILEATVLSLIGKLILYYNYGVLYLKAPLLELSLNVSVYHGQLQRMKFYDTTV